MRVVHITTALVAASLLASLASAQTRTSQVTCGTSSACFPWSAQGPFCGRGADINLRFQLQLTEPNYIADADRAEPYSNVTYAFCPRVDELQAFNITRAGELAFTFTNQTTGETQWMVENERYLSIIGMGDTRDVSYPQEGSAGRAMIADYFARAGDTSSQCARNTEIAAVPFLIFNVSMDEGRFRYYEGHPQPAGVGFVPSCDEFNVCLFDSALKCIGDEGNRNCAECIDIETAKSYSTQVWVSYYGTDASGRQLRSGANNPLNFQAYSGSGVSSSMRRSFNNLENGGSSDPDGLEPA
jgi:hypothetical protein